MTIKELLLNLNSNIFDNRILEVYDDLATSKGRISSLAQKHLEHFGDCSEVGVFTAPGRTEICGNHTDHQHGKVLAAAINKDILAVASKNNSSVITIYSDGYGKLAVDTEKLLKIDDEIGTSTALIKGICNGYKTKGYKIGGFDATITSDVPSGSGLSSSAAYEVLIGRIISELYNIGISAEENAIIGAYAENEYFGKPSGLMDQTACSVGGCVYIDFKCPDKPVIEPLTFDPAKNGYMIIITDCRSSHADLTDEYAAITKEMKEIAAYFGSDFLRNVPENEFWSNIGKIRGNISDRAVLRAIHFYNEENRVEKLKTEILENHFENALDIINASGNSSYKFLQNVFSAKDTFNQSLSVGIAASEKIIGGSGAVRVHGGGFAGTIQAYIPASKTEEYIAAMEAIAGSGCCYIIKTRPQGSIKLL